MRESSRREVVSAQASLRRGGVLWANSALNMQLNLRTWSSRWVNPGGTLGDFLCEGWRPQFHVETSVADTQ